MLYLPASWLHEVTSYSSSDSDTDSVVHMAMNWWFHPPTEQSYHQPYVDGYWADSWKVVEEALEKMKETDVVF
jgi:hypothetical protein